jgi:hypothetical protein
LDPVPADADAWHVALKHQLRRKGAACTLAVFAAAIVFADGSVMLFRKRADPFIVTAFGEPVPARVGLVDLSVMLQRANDHGTVLDASVMLRLKKSSTGTITEVVAPATHARATNKLLYAAHVTLPSAGKWQVSVEVKQGNATASVSGAMSVLPQEAPATTYWPYFVMVPLFVLLFILNRWLRRKWGVRNPQARP